MNINQDAEHLRLLSVFHYIYAAITICYSLFALIYVVIGLMFTAVPFLDDELSHSTKRPIPTASEQRRSAEEKAAAGNNEPATDNPTKSDKQRADDTGPATNGASTSAKEIPSEATQTDASDSESAQYRDGRHPTPPRFFPATFGLFFVCIGVLGLVIGVTYALAQLFAGRFIAQRKHRVFCMIVSGFNCLNFPVGVVLAVFTFIVLARPSVKLLFEKEKAGGFEPVCK